MTGARLGPTRDFRPSRATRSATAATTGSATGATGSSGTTAGTIATRTRSISRPPSGVGGSNSRPGSAINTNVGDSRSGPSTGIPTATRPGAGIAGTTSGPGASRNGPTAGAKRKTRATSGDMLAEKEPTTSKRPALSGAFSAHLTQTSLNRQLLVAQNEITEVQNSLLEKQRDIDRLEADLRLVSSREEEEREARVRSEEELSRKTTHYETELSSLKKKLVEIEADHDDLSDAYSNLSHSSQSKIAILNVEVSTRNERISLLEQELKDAVTRAQEGEVRTKALEDLLEQLTEDEPGEDGTKTVEKKQVEGEEQRSESIDHQKEVGGVKMEFKEPETSADESTPDNVNADDKAGELESNADADGEADLDEEVSMVVDTTADDDVTPVGDMEVSSIRSASDMNTFYERGQPEIPAYPDPGAPPPYLPSSPSLSSSHSTPSRLRSAPSEAGSEASSRAMSISMDGQHIQDLLRSPETPDSMASIPRLDSLSRIRSRLSLASSVRRHPSLEASRSRERDNEIIRAELARQVPHMTRLEDTNRHLMNEIAQLRKQIGSIEVLREEKRDMERRMEGMDALRTRVAELETAAAEFAHREQELQARLRDRGQVNDENNTSARTPVGVTQQLAALRRTHAALLDEHGELKAALRTNEVELASVRQEADEATRNSERLSREVEQLQAALTRKEKERALLERDVTFLRSLISSYKNEEVANTSIGDEENAGTEKLEQRVMQLEALLLEYKAAIASLQEEVDRLQRSGGRTSNKSQEEWDQLLNKAVLLGEAFKNAQAEVTKQADRIEELEQRLFELGGEIGTGRHIPPATRVLTLRQNPAQEWADTRKAVLDRLKAENEALLARIKELEESGLSGTPATSEPNGERAQFVPRASWEALKKETEEQAAVIAQKEKRLLRLQQVYAAKSTEFREAIESILGLKIAFYPNGQVRLTSIYDLSAAFVFQSSKDESGGTKMQLIAKGDKCPEELEGLMNIWIRDEMSIPCFMSSITLECYDRSKRGEVGIDFE